MRYGDLGSYFAMVSSFGMCFAIIFAIHVIVMTFGKDYIERPAVYRWGAMLFAASVAIPVVGLTVATFFNFTASMTGYTRSGIDMGLGTAIMVIVGVISPVLFAASLCATFAALIPAGSSRSAANKETPEVSEPRIHPLDRPD